MTPEQRAELWGAMERAEPLMRDALIEAWAERDAAVTKLADRDKRLAEIGFQIDDFYALLPEERPGAPVLQNIRAILGRHHD